MYACATCPQTPSPDGKPTAKINNVSDTGGPGDEDETMALRKEIERLKEANLTLMEENDCLKPAAEARQHPNDGNDEDVGDDAFGKRLERMCRRKKNWPLVSNRPVFVEDFLSAVKWGPVSTY